MTKDTSASPPSETGPSTDWSAFERAVSAVPHRPEWDGHLVRADSATPRRVKWLWGGRIPLRTVTTLVGLAGIAKSQTVCSIARDLTLGVDDREPENVLILSAEDPLEEVLVPRLRAAGADESRVYTLKVGLGGVELPKDVENGKLEQYVLEAEARLLVLDPIVAYVDGQRTDTHKMSDVRHLLRLLSEMAERCNIAVLVVQHFKKGEAGNVLHQISGSAGFGDATRSALAAARDPRWDGADADAPFVLLHVKNNYGRKRPALRYHVEGVTIDVDGGTIETSRVVWDGEDPTVTEDDVFGSRSPGPRQEERVEAKEFLASWLRYGPVDVSTVEKAAKEAKISAASLKRARKDMGIVSKSIRGEDGRVTGHQLQLPK